MTKFKEKYEVIEEVRAGICKHREEDFVDYELEKVQGIVWCTWKCRCGLKVAHLVGEALIPLKIPKDPVKGQQWREE